MITDGTIWLVIILLALGTFAIRFSFLGILGGRKLPDWVSLHLKYVGVAVFPALVTPLTIWPKATGGETDPLRMIAAVAALLAGWKLGVIWALVVGMGTLYALQYLFG